MVDSKTYVDAGAAVPFQVAAARGDMQHIGKRYSSFCIIRGNQERYSSGDNGVREHQLQNNNINNKPSKQNTELVGITLSQRLEGN
jgi:hypothetical protein